MADDYRRREALSVIGFVGAVGLTGCSSLRFPDGDDGPEGFDDPSEGNTQPVDPVGDADLGDTVSTMWPTFGGDSTNAGGSDVRLEGPLVHQWTARYPSDMLIHDAFGAIVSDGRVFTFRKKIEDGNSVHRDVLVALNAGSGELMWTSQTDVFGTWSAETYYTGTAVDGTLYVCLDGPDSSDEPQDAVLAVSTENGEHEWVRKIDGTVRGTPAIRNGVLYVGGSATVYALDAETGEPMWAADRGPFSRSVATNGRIVVAVSEDHLVAFDAKTGEEEWTLELTTGQNQSKSPVCVDETVVYVRDNTGFVVDADSGTVRWQTDSRSVDGPKPAVGDDVVIFVHNEQEEPDGGHPKGVVRAYGLQSGEMRWETTIRAEVMAPTVISDEYVYALAENETLYRISIKDGSIVDRTWYRGRETASEPAVTELGVFVNHNHGVTALNTGERAQLSDAGRWPSAGYDRTNPRRNPDATPPRADIEVAWSIEANDPAGLVVSHGLVMFSERGGLFGVNADSGEVRWRVPTSSARSGASRSLVVVDDTVCVGAPDGTVMGLSLPEGSIEWTYETDGDFIAPSVHADGVLYSITHEDTTIHGINPETGESVLRASTGGQGSVNVAPAAGQDRLFVAQSGLLTFDTSGDLLWRHRPSRYPVLSPSLLGDRLIATVNDGTARAYTLAGKPLWTADLGATEDGMSMMPPAIHNGNVIAAGIVPSDQPPVISSINGQSGDIRWRVETDAIDSEPIVADSRIWFTENGDLVGLDPASGDRVVSAPIGQSAASIYRLFSAGNRIYGVGSNKIFALE